MKKQQINPPEMNMRIKRKETTLTALSTCRQRPVNAPSTCRQHDRQRSLQETGQNSTGKSIDDRKDLEKTKLKLTHFYPPGRKIEKILNIDLDEVTK